LPDDLITIDAAVQRLRVDPASADLVRDAYLGRDVDDSCERFASSGEFTEVKRILASRIEAATILDLGAGTGIASAAFVGAGAGRVIAVEPDPSDEVGRGAMARMADRKFEVVAGFGETIPLADASVDIVYCRQVLHHARDLRQLIGECARVLKPGGLFFACREHVVDNEQQLRDHLAAHPVHRLAGGESAYSLPSYLHAIRGAGLVVDRVFKPLDSVINAFPAFRTQTEVDAWPAVQLARKLGPLGRIAAHLPGATAIVRKRLDKPVPGRMYSFLAHRPGRAITPQ
jgi:SAM-dependent methyltransferase